MDHVVFFPAPGGTPAFRRFSSVEEAVRFVEHLRNAENVSEASLYALTEVPLSFKAVYRVEVGSAAATEPAARPVAVAAAEEPARAVPVAEEPTGAVPVAVDLPNGKAAELAAELTREPAAASAEVAGAEPPAVHGGGPSRSAARHAGPAVDGSGPAPAGSGVGPDILPGALVVPLPPVASGGAPEPARAGAPLEADASVPASAMAAVGDGRPDEPGAGPKERGLGFFAR